MSKPDSTPPTGRRATLKDVAKDTGYHITTISMALRGHPSIPSETRTRIEAAASRLGYQRNPVFQALSRFRQQGRVRAPSPRIAYLENFGAGSGISRPPHLQDMLDGATKQAGVLGYQLDVLAVGEDDLDSRAVSQHLREHEIHGIVMGSFSPGCAEIALNWDEFAVAKIISRHTEPEVTVVSNDHLREVRLAYSRLRALGYQRIGLAVGRADEDACGYRHTAGYLMELNHIPPERQIPPLIFPYYNNGSMLAGMIHRWILRHHVDVVLCNWHSIKVMIEREGLRVPDQVACACLCLCGAHTDASLAGIHPKLNLVGERAVSIVVSQLKSGQLGVPECASSLYVQSTWQDGPSAPPRH